jgi:3-methyladenine DNA glycosylase AlkC
MVKVGERFENMRIEGGDHLTAEQKVQLKKQYAKELLKDSRVKKDIDVDIDDISKQKSDMVYEVMRQHGLLKNQSESTYIHDQLSLIFDQCLWNVRVCVKRGAWDALGF